jgi:hypothetical protein
MSNTQHVPPEDTWLSQPLMAEAQTMLHTLQTRKETFQAMVQAGLDSDDIHERIATVRQQATSISQAMNLIEKAYRDRDLPLEEQDIVITRLAGLSRLSPSKVLCRYWDEARINLEYLQDAKAHCISDPDPGLMEYELEDLDVNIAVTKLIFGMLSDAINKHLPFSNAERNQQRHAIFRGGITRGTLPAQGDGRAHVHSRSIRSLLSRCGAFFGL